jgi:isopentenyl-diphosphate delta-isomerase
MGVGSQRLELDSGRAGQESDHWRTLRDEVPGLELFANIGISQAIHAPTQKLKALVDSLRARYLVIHLNALQEAIQPEGTTDFRGGLEAIKRICGELGTPVVVKETGCGFSAATLSRLNSVGLAAVDVSGLGGTHWGRIEGARAKEASSSLTKSAKFASIQAQVADDFKNWGESTVSSVLAACQELDSRTEIWASGGVRSGLDAAKLLALGAKRVGYAQPALQAALADLSNEGALEHWMETQEYGLRVALFCTGSASPEHLREKEGVWKIKGI